MVISTSIILDTRRETKNGFPIKIRVYYGKKSKYISLNKYSSISNWDENNVLKSHPDYRKLFFSLKKRSISLLEEVEYCNDNNLNLEQSVKVIKDGLGNKETEIFTLRQKIKTLEKESNIGLIEFYDVIIEEKEK